MFHRARQSSLWPALGLAIFLMATRAADRLWAAAPRVLTPGWQPDDRRLEDLRDFNTPAPFTPPASPKAWTRRAVRVRRQMLVAAGLWPMPTPATAAPVVHGRIDRGDYTVEKVYLQSFPGHFVTGNLYRPKGKAGPAAGRPLPAWPLAMAAGFSTAAAMKFASRSCRRGAIRRRGPLDDAGPLRQLARMGAVVFHYDMLGYADSQQFP